MTPLAVLELLDPEVEYRRKCFKRKKSTTEYQIGARYYDPDVGVWTSVDPLREYHSPYNYVGNNPINAIDPTGLSTELVLDKNQNITSVERFDDSDPTVWVFDHNGMEISSNAAEPPDGSYFYQENPSGGYVIQGQNFVGNWNASANEFLNNAYNAFPTDALDWRSDGDLDFKFTRKNQVSIIFGTAMTSRGAGNALWGGWVRNMYIG